MRSILFAVLVCSVAATAGAEPPAVFGSDTLGDGSIGVFADPEGTEPCATIEPGSFATLYVVGTLGGATSGGAGGAEFRIEVSNPNGWLFSYSPPPNTPVTIGNPLDQFPDDPNNYVGVNIGFPMCQLGPKMDLGTILAVNQGGQPTELRVLRRMPPGNRGWPCPLFTQCDHPNYTKVCLGTCTTSSVGEAITFVGSINDPSCASKPSCPATCAGAPCVRVESVADRRACPGAAVPVSGTVTNCGTEPADIDIFIDFVLAGSYVGVAPGAVVTATRDVVQSNCDRPNYDPNFVGVVARNTFCLEPVGAESVQKVICDQRVCDGNLPPDCSNARVTPPRLFPPTGEMVPIAIEGIIDPNGDPLQVRVIGVTSDEPSAARTACVDAMVERDGSVSLRAARRGNGNGRVYAIDYQAAEPSGLRCTGRLFVCVAKTPNESCVDDGQTYHPTWECAPSELEPAGGIRAAPVRRTGVRISLASPPRSAARIEIFDARGRRVSVIDESRVPPGTTELLWDGRDSGGRLAARGVYLIRAVVDGETYSVKSVLVR